MTDGLLNLAPIWDSISGLVLRFKVPLVAMLAVYLGLFLVGLVIEAVRSSRAGGSSNG